VLWADPGKVSYALYLAATPQAAAPAAASPASEARGPRGKKRRASGGRHC
jgi:hypothetical protein